MILALATAHPDDQFILLVEFLTNDNSGYSKNMTLVTMGAHANNALSFRLWYNHKLPALLKTYKADLFIANDYISFSSKLPQYFVVNNQNADSKKTKLFLEKAKCIISNTVVSQKYLTDNFQIAKEKIKVIYPAYDRAFIAIDWKEKEAVKEKFTEQKEYFLCNGNTCSHAEMIQLLKAFSYFKKWQKSNMQLVIAADDAVVFNSLKKDLDNYKFRDEVKLVQFENTKETTAITAAAYAFVELSKIADYRNVINGMRCNVPAIVAESAVATELFADHVLYAGDHFESLGKQLVLIFKDETTRDHLINAGTKLLSQFDPDQSSAKLWQTIAATTG